MLRGSRPGERRGGRTRGTPNRRTILQDAILSIGLDHPAASQREFLVKLVKDSKLPADIRMAIAPQCFPLNRTPSSRAGRPRALGSNRTTTAQVLTADDSGMRSNASQKSAVAPAARRDWNPYALDALFGAIQDATASLKVRRQAALQIAEFLLPKIGKKPKIIADEYGFSISPKLASAYRDIKLELGALVSQPTRKIPAIAAKIEKLAARLDAIRRRLELPCPTKYGDEESLNDYLRLIEFAALRENGTALTEVQKAEEAHRRARYDVFCAGPEAIARRRREELEEADRRFRRYRSDKDFRAPPLSRKERKELKLLRWLYPAEPRPNQFEHDDDRFEKDYHPFAHELPAPNGIFYPRDSKFRPTAPKDDADPKLSGEARIYDLEERRAIELPLTASDEEELRDLRKRHPEYAAAMDLMDLRYLYHWGQEFEIARKAGLDIHAIYKQVEVCCLRIRDDSKFVHEWEARRCVRTGAPPALVVGKYSEHMLAFG
jgi:hypothetical protein